VLVDAAELDVQPDRLSNTPEGQHHTSLHVVPTRTMTLLDHHPTLLPIRREVPSRLGRAIRPRCGPTISVAGLQIIEALSTVNFKGSYHRARGGCGPPGSM
jgi:hypothetical protein